MPWKGVTTMDQRVRFISEYLDGYFSIAELCRQFNVSRKTGYKWLSRYEDYGWRGVEERSSKPHSCPHKTHYTANGVKLSLYILRKFLNA
jgi:transposase